MGKRKDRPVIKVVSHFFEVNGQLVEIDPFKTDLPDRCKLAIAEALTGKRYELLELASSS